ncbi:SOS response-associated peptidase [Alkalibacterium olivapovliticus]|uniref:Abasic site processing protein n=1 Tax=Alkalibacterium olivapovliticus TaxID=99907 RepID=A0A2T0W5I3_9LACT|nr:SOS response-associated peptidase [Alkalibacterium olivapovliticus]PRY81041.1 putative SOS response-associated peptidase YedK [Alkalibacterium olivapovliticus]
MCGRYGLTVSEQELIDRYQLDPEDYSLDAYEIEEKEEIFPTTENIVLLPNHKLYPVKWGFTPSFAKRPLINARSESIQEKKTFKEPFATKRCIVPASYFFEWKKNEDQKKEKKLIRVKDLPVFSMAGVCERYTDDNGKSYLTYAILTTEANDQMKPIHDRMPVILDQKDEAMYLKLDTDLTKVQTLLKPTKRELVIE